MNVYVVMSHNKANYPNENSIVGICLTEDIANDLIKDWQKSKLFSRKNEYWIEDYELNTGNLNVFKDPDDGSIRIS